MSNRTDDRRAGPEARLSWAWTFGGAESRAETSQLLALLRGISRHRALGEAARDAGVSYRHGWGLIRRVEQSLSRSLVTMRRGRGSELTPLAREMLAADDEARALLAPHVEAARQPMARALDRGSLRSEQPLAIHASHDFALAMLVESLRERGTAVVLTTRGSREALDDLASGRCDVAGFHVARGPAAAAAWRRYRPLLDERGHELVVLARRMQGILTAPANPLGIHTLADLAAKRVRFINRQPDSGTRLLLDLLLADGGVDPACIDGYETVEFTHAAVAAMIASGAADAGVGVAAAAARHGLGFIPLAQEDYLLAMPVEPRGSGTSALLAAAIRSPAFRKALAALEGYARAGDLRMLSPGAYEAGL